MELPTHTWRHTVHIQQQQHGEEFMVQLDSCGRCEETDSRHSGVASVDPHHTAAVTPGVFCDRAHSIGQFHLMSCLL